MHRKRMSSRGLEHARSRQRRVARAYYDEDHFKLFWGNTSERIAANCNALAWLLRGVDDEEAGWRKAEATFSKKRTKWRSISASG
jgi:hypothetical protein